MGWNCDNFFKTLNDKKDITSGEKKAVAAWKAGREDGTWLIPLLTESLLPEEIDDFLRTIKSAGENDFMFADSSEHAFASIVEFTKRGWVIYQTAVYGKGFPKKEGLWFIYQEC